MSHIHLLVRYIARYSPTSETILFYMIMPIRLVLACSGCKWQRVLQRFDSLA